MKASLSFTGTHSSVLQKYSLSILIKGTIQQEDVTMLSICALNISVHKFIKQTFLSLKKQIGPDTIIVGDLNTPLPSTDRTSR
jgi:hypothetical protein